MLYADYDLIRKDFADQHIDDRYPLNSMVYRTIKDATDAEIDDWLVRNAGWISAGQVARISPEGDHGPLLGVENIDDYVDCSTQKPGFRIRSGGRAATFLVRDAYHFEDGSLRASMIEAKGIGTHEEANFGASTKNTGMLSLADALRELCYQKLVQRIIELEELDDEFCCVQFYGLLDTGLKYVGENPATGWKGERCVLAVRQRQSRAFCSYGGYNFSGVLLMTGEEQPPPSITTGAGYKLRKALIKYGISAEITPQAPFSQSLAEALENRTGNWNLQADANLSHFMDFSDFYGLPDSPLSDWRISETCFRDCWTLSSTQIVT